MNNKQKLGYTLLGAGIMAVGITIGQFLTPNISRGALFRRVLKNGKITTTRLSPEAIREIVKKRSQGIRGVKGRVSGHSLRVGSAVSLARGNASLVAMQVDGRWKDSRMPSHYASAEIAKNSATARIKYGKRR